MNYDDKYSMYVFDIDGTLRRTLSGKVCPNEVTDQVLLPNVKDVLTAMRNRHESIYACTNQGGVSCGYFRQEDFYKGYFYLCDLLGLQFDALEVSFYHKDGKYKDMFQDKSKPKPDMLGYISVLAIAENVPSLGKATAPVNTLSNKESTLFVGDGYTDKKAAEAFGCSFMWAHEFFQWENYQETKWGYNCLVPQMECSQD